MMSKKRICVYAASSDGVGEPYRQACRQLAESLARRGETLVYGAGAIGLMGLIADIFLEYQCHTIGIITEKLNRPEIVHHGLKELHIVADMRERKRRMEELADCFIACPGSLGTLEELFEIMTLKQLEYHNKPIVVFSPHDFFQPLYHYLEFLCEKNFLKRDFLDLAFFTDYVPDILEYLDTYQPVQRESKLFSHDCEPLCP